MNRQNRGRAFASAMLGVGVALAQVSPQPPYYQNYQNYQTATPSEVAPKNPLLLALIVQPLLQQSGVSLASGIGMLFSRLFSALAGHHGTSPNAMPQYAGGPPAYGAAPTGTPGYVPQYGTSYTPSGPYPPGAQSATPGNYPPTYGAVAPPPYTGGTGYPPGVQSPAYPGYSPAAVTPSPGGTYAPGAANPAVPTYPPAAAAAPPTGAYSAGMQAPTAAGYSSYPGTGQIGTLPPGTVKSAVVPSVVYTLNQLDPHSYTTVSQIDLAHGAPTLHTGDVFAIEYATNLSGQVRIDNVDSRGQTTALGTYTVLAGHDNRIPVTKGIQLVGATGTETFKLYFFPCVPSDTRGSPGVGASSAGLPTCPSGPSPKLLQASKGLALPKGAVNLDSPDPTIAVSAVTDYQPNDITENDFRIQHIAQQ